MICNIALVARSTKDIFRTNRKHWQECHLNKKYYLLRIKENERINKTHTIKLTKIH